MLRIKKDVSWEELEKFGFRYNVNDCCKPKYEWYEKDEHYQGYSVTKSKGNKELQIIVMNEYGMNADTLYDLIQANLVEKVSEGENE